jgi:Tol biopolymer transport system component
MLSPDGRWIVYHSLPRGVEPLSQSAGVFARAFPSGPVRQAPRVGRDSQPVWSPKGNELFYVQGAGAPLVAVRVDWTSALQFRTVQSLPGAIVGRRLSSSTRAFDVMPDGRFVGLLGESAAELEARESVPREVRIVLNWFEDLKRLVPAK